MSRRNKKICILVGYYPINKGGAEYQSYLFARELRKKYDVFYISVGQNCTEKLLDDGFIVYKLKTPILRSYSLLAPKILKILRNENPDFIYQRVGYSATGIAAFYCKNHICKLIWQTASHQDVTSRKIEFSRNYLSKKIEQIIFKYGVRNADFIFCQSNMQKELLYKNLNREAHGVIKTFHPIPKEEIAKNETPTVVWIANIKKLKRPEIFVNLAEKLQGFDAKFYIIGRNQERKWFAPILKKIDKQKNVEYLGEKTNDQVNEILNESHILINTSITEGFSNTFVQAWLRRVPVISLSVDPDNILENKKIGFHSRKFSQLIDDTKYLIEHHSEREKMGRRAYEYASENHSLKNLQSYIKIIEKN